MNSTEHIAMSIESAFVRPLVRRGSMKDYRVRLYITLVKCLFLTQEKTELNLDLDLDL